jgi:hypothetical protein
MKAWGQTTDRILLLLQEGELTKIQICSALGLTHDDVASVLTRLRRDSIKFGKRIYICGYERTAIGKKYHLRPIFKLGGSPDKPKPPAFTTKERAAKSHKKRMLIKRSQIFRGQYGIRP